MVNVVIFYSNVRILLKSKFLWNYFISDPHPMHVGHIVFQSNQKVNWTNVMSRPMLCSDQLGSFQKWIFWCHMFGWDTYNNPFINKAILFKFVAMELFDRIVKQFWILSIMNCFYCFCISQNNRTHFGLIRPFISFY